MGVRKMQLRTCQNQVSDKLLQLSCLIAWCLQYRLWQR